MRLVLTCSLMLVLACGSDPKPQPGEGGAGGEVVGVGGAGGEGGSATTGSVLDGAEDDLALDALPDLEPERTDVSRLLVEGPLVITADRVLLSLNEATTVGAVNDYAIALGAELTYTVPDLGVLALEPGERTGDLAWLDTALTEADARGLAATMDIVLSDHGLPAAHAATEWSYESLGNRSWGLQNARIPMLWNLRRYMVDNASSRPQAVVLDSGFREHVDVSFSTAEGMDAKGAHGLTCASVMTAHWNEVGYEGAFPSDGQLAIEVRNRLTNNLWETDPRVDTSIRVFSIVANELHTARLLGFPAVINHSHGINYLFPKGRQYGDKKVWQLKHTDRDWRGETYERAFERIGRAYVNGAAVYERNHGWSKWLYLCTTGNTRVDAERKAVWDGDATPVDVYAPPAWAASGCAWAAAKGTGAQAGHYLVIENHRGSSLHPWSSRGGTMAAPGTDVGALKLGDGGAVTYGEVSGTSYAAPMTAGVVMMLWTLHPSASYLDIRNALLDGARAPLGDSAWVLDAWGAAEELKNVGGDGPDVTHLIADVDDGTLDGSLRAHPATMAAQPDVSVFERGDGCVDMADFRAFRDAFFDLDPTHFPYAPFGQTTVKRDYNGDGQVEWEASSQAEGYWPRFNLDGAGVVDANDLAVLQGHWGACHDQGGTAKTEGVTAGELPALLTGSFDAWVPVSGTSPIATYQDTTIVFPHKTLTLTAAEVEARSIDFLLLETVPVASCSGSNTEVKVTVGSDPEVIVYCPSSPTEAMDYVLGRPL